MRKWFVVYVAGVMMLGTVGADAAITSCSSVSSCIFGSNSSSGTGVEGGSSKGFGIAGVSSSGHGVNGTSVTSFGVVGITTENATSTGTARAGVLGEDSSTNKKAFNSGVAGSSAYGYGVTGTTTAYGSTAYGGKFTGTPNGLFTNEMDVDDVQALNNQSDTQNPLLSGGGYFNVYGIYRDSGDGAFPPELMINGIGCAISPYEPYPQADNCSSVFNVYSDGTGSFQGTVYSSGSDVKRTKSTSGKDVATFNARSASPTLEDFGTATLRNGAASVALEPTFASTISPGYMVFVTPHGDSNSLYTVNSPNGFVVRESKGGRSTLSFDYRIVGKPLDAKAMHMPSTKMFPAFEKRIMARRAASTLR